MASPVTWNPSDKHANISLSNGDLTATAAATNHKAVRATLSYPSGKKYFEIFIAVRPDQYQYHGIATSSASLAAYLGSDAHGWSYDMAGYKRHAGGSALVGVTFAQGDIMGVAVDVTAGKVWFAKNNVWVGSGDPANGTNEAYQDNDIITYGVFPAASIYANTAAVTGRFSTQDTTFSPPDGFDCWEQVNYYFSGYVYEQSTPVSRQVYLYKRDTGELIGGTTSSGDGYYYLETTYSGQHFIICLDNVAGETYNLLGYDLVVPVQV